MEDMIYKVPLDGVADKDLIEWINSLPRNKKAEVVRHALRFYKSHLTEGETMFVMPSARAVSPEEMVELPPVKQEKIKPVIKKKKPPVGLGGMIRGE